jgi:Tol biopolymer transport system component
LVLPDNNSSSDVFVWDSASQKAVLASVSTSLSTGNGPSFSPLISADGRYVAFQSRASNLVPRTSGTNWFLRDLGSNTTTVLDKKTADFRGDGQVITTSNGITLRRGFIEPSSFSADNRFEAYLSNAGGARTNSSAGIFQVYLEDHAAQTNELVSRNEGGSPAGWCDGAFPVVSEEGRYVVFESMDGTIFPGDNNQSMDLFLFDAVNKHVELISARDARSAPALLNGFTSFSSRTGALSKDGAKMALIAWSTNLIANDANLNQKALVHDFVSDYNLVFEGTAFSTDPVLSGDGQHLSFASTFQGLIQTDTNGYEDIFERGLITGIEYPVSTTPSGGFPSNDSYDPSLSRNGSILAFTSDANDVTAISDGNRRSDVFVRDMVSGVTSLASISAEGSTSANGPSWQPILSPDGKWLAFLSAASNLVSGGTPGNALYLRNLEQEVTVRLGQTLAIPVFAADSGFLLFESTDDNPALQDTNGKADLFLRDLGKESTELISAGATGASGDGNSHAGAISPDGRFVVFSSDSSNLVPNDSNGVSDIFMRDRASGIITLISKNAANGGSANGASDLPVMSSDGRFVAFRSSARDLTADAVNAAAQIYVHDTWTQKTILATRSVRRAGSSDDRCGAPLLSADGKTLIVKSFASDLTAGANLSQAVFYYRLAGVDFGDSDGDGLDDEWEQAYFGGLNHDGGADTDEDGQSDAAEFVAGTDPMDSSSVFRNEFVHAGSGETAVLRWSTVPGRNYWIQYKDDLNEFLWRGLAVQTALSTPSAAEFADESSVNVEQRYYRIVVTR